MAKHSVVYSEQAVEFTFPSPSSAFPEAQDYEEGEHQQQRDGHCRAEDHKIPIVWGALEEGQAR